MCSANYAGGLGFTCTECSGSTDGIAVAAALSVVAALVLVVVIAYLFSDKSRSGTSGIVDPISKNVPLQSLKIIIVAWQIITQVRTQVVRTLFLQLKTLLPVVIRTRPLRLNHFPRVRPFLQRQLSNRMKNEKIIATVGLYPLCMFVEPT